MEDLNNFINAWHQFLSSLVEVAELKVESKKQAYEKSLLPLLEEVVNDLKKDREVLRNALQAEIEENKDSKTVLNYLRKEFTFFVDLVEEVKENDDNKSVDEAIDAGKTIKDSFEKLIKKLSKRWKKVLKVLNELLNLLKNAS